MVFFIARTLLCKACAKKQSSENPVYYVQYAHARIASILRKGAEARLLPAGSVAGALGGALGGAPGWALGGPLGEALGGAAGGDAAGEAAGGVRGGVRGGVPGGVRGGAVAGALGGAPEATLVRQIVRPRPSRRASPTNTSAAKSTDRGGAA